MPVEVLRVKIVAGLGNPGQKYANTRHNAGFMVVDVLASWMGIAVSVKKCAALTGLGRIGAVDVLLAKPQTYMNLSGRSVAALLKQYRLSPADLVVVYDDLDLPPGRIRVRPKGGSAGHRGVQSIIDALGTQDFPRVRVGIGRPDGPEADPVDFVLAPLRGDEAEQLAKAAELAACAVRCLLTDGVEQAMNEYNRR